MRRFVLTAIIFALLFSSIVSVQIVEADSQTQRPLFFSGINIVSPSNSTYSSNMLTLNVTTKALQGIDINILMNYSIDGKHEGIIPTTTKIEPINATITYANGTTTFGPSIQSPNVTKGYVTLPKLPEGTHNITVYAKYDYPNTNRFVTPYPGTITYFENSTVCFIIDLNPTSFPIISSLSIENKTYNSNSIPLNFNIDKAWSKITYSLNNQANITIIENITLTGLIDGSYNLTIYANDTAGNVGKSDNVFFTVNTQPIPTPTLTPSPSLSQSPVPTQQQTIEPSPTAYNIQAENFTPAIILFGSIALAVVVGVLVYFKKRK